MAIDYLDHKMSFGEIAAKYDIAALYGLQEGRGYLRVKAILMAHEVPLREKHKAPEDSAAYFREWAQAQLIKNPPKMLGHLIVMELDQRDRSVGFMQVQGVANKRGSRGGLWGRSRMATFVANRSLRDEMVSAGLLPFNRGRPTFKYWT